MTERRFLRFEGGHIGVTVDRLEAVNWYCRHLGLTVAWDQQAEGQTLLRFPGSQAIPLVSVAGGESDNVWGDSTHAVRESPVRLCLACPDVEATHAALTAEGVRVTWIDLNDAMGHAFDFYDLEGTRLTAVATPSEPSTPDLPATHRPGSASAISPRASTGTAATSAWWCRPTEPRMATHV